MCGFIKRTRAKEGLKMSFVQYGHSRSPYITRLPLDLLLQSLFIFSTILINQAHKVPDIPNAIPKYSQCFCLYLKRLVQTFFSLF